MGGDKMGDDKMGDDKMGDDDNKRAGGKPGPVKTAQPFSADAADTRDEAVAGTGGDPRPDALRDPNKIAESDKVTRRQE